MGMQVDGRPNVIGFFLGCFRQIFGERCREIVNDEDLFVVAVVVLIDTVVVVIIVGREKCAIGCLHQGIFHRLGSDGKHDGGLAATVSDCAGDQLQHLRARMMMSLSLLLLYSRG